MKETTIFRVAAKTTPRKLAGAIAKAVRDGQVPELRCVGAGPVNAGVKAVAIANGTLAPTGTTLDVTPAFMDLELEGEERTAMRLVAKPKGPRP